MRRIVKTHEENVQGKSKKKSSQELGKKIANKNGKESGNKQCKIS